MVSQKGIPVMKKLSIYLLFGVAAVLSLSLAFLLPSFALTEDARARYDEMLEEKWEEETEEAEAAGLTPRAVLASAGDSDVIVIDVDGEEPEEKEVVPLAIDLFTPGSAPLLGHYTETGYHDASIDVEMEQYRMYDSDVFVARVSIADPSQLRTAIAGTKMGASRTDKITRMCENYNGIVAINGDYYTRSSLKSGYLVRMGKVYREKGSNDLDLLLIDENGDFHTCAHGRKAMEAWVKEFKASGHQIVNGLMFGPILVTGGEVSTTTIEDCTYYSPKQPNPRAAIAQTGPLSYLMVVVNGRTSASEGVTLKEFAEILVELGAQEAYNLDGGNSATLVFRGEVYNDKPQDERSVPDIIYFASALEED